MDLTLTNALSIPCPDDELFGICRQLQLLLSEAGIKMAVLRDNLQALEWLAYARQEGTSDPAWRY